MVIYCIPLVFVGLLSLFSCSQDDNASFVNPSKTFSMSTFVGNRISDEYVELGNIPEEYLEGMDEAEKEAWNRLSTKYYIKKNVFGSVFYQKHKADISERINFLYECAVKKNYQPSNLSFVWADRESALKKTYRIVNEDDTLGIEEPPIGSDSGYVDYPTRRETHCNAECTVFSRNLGSEYMKMGINYTVIESGYSIQIEKEDTYTEVCPSYAWFSGYSNINLEEGSVARCFVYGQFHVRSQSYNVNCASSIDLIDAWNNANK